MICSSVRSAFVASHVAFFVSVFGIAVVAVAVVVVVVVVVLVDGIVVAVAGLLLVKILILNTEVHSNENFLLQCFAGQHDHYL